MCLAEEKNTAPLQFGMRPHAAAQAQGAPLAYLRGRRGSEVYVSSRGIPVVGFYGVEEGTALQFRRGRLTGWKHDWRIHDWPY